MAKTQTTLTQSVIPSWYTNYAQQTLANQQAVASQPFTPYTEPRVAEFNETQQQGLGLAQDATTNYKADLDTAIGNLKNTTSRSSFGVSQPYFEQAGDNSKLGEAYGALGQAAGLAQQSTGPLGLAMASPLLQAGGERSYERVQDYMNPYIENVIDRYGELGARTLREKLLPEIGDRYISNGQAGYGPPPSGMTTDALRALRDVQDSVGQQQLAALSQAYESSLGHSATDAARMASLAGTAGSLGFQQQGALAAAAGQMGQIGSSTASISQNNQQILSDLASKIAAVYGQDTANAMSASGQLAQMAQQMQQQSLAGSQALSTIGQQQQATEQAALDAQYQEFLRENAYDQQQIDAMANTLGAVSPAIPQAQVSITSKNSPTTSTLGTLAGLASTYAGLSK